MSDQNHKKKSKLNAEDQKAKQDLLALNRRRFLQVSTSAITGATAALAGGKRSWYAFAEAQQQRPRLVAIHLENGWDTNWFHMAFPRSKITSAADNPNLYDGMPRKDWDMSKETPPIPSTVTGDALEKYKTPENLDPLSRKVETDDQGVITGFYHQRYTERQKEDKLLAHPNAMGHFLGIGAQNAFGINTLGSLGGSIDNLVSKTCIWKGLYSGGGHNIPNKNILHGSTSQYAISFSGLISEALSQRHGKMTLHYVQLTETPSIFGSNWAMAKGDQVPINIGSINAFKGLTQKSSTFSDPNYNEINQSVARLGEQFGKERFSLARSKEIYSEFVRFFRGSLQIMELGSNMSGFYTLWAEYANYMRERVSNMLQPGFLNSVSSEVALPFRNLAYTFHLLTPYQIGLTLQGSTTPLADQGASTPSQAYSLSIKSFYDALTTPYTPDDASLTNIINPDPTRATSIRGYIAYIAWKFAMADFMILSGYSNVVDLHIQTMDAHSNNSGELLSLTAIYSGYAKFLDRLKGASLLDQTLVVMFSEFDRSAALTTDTSKDDRGTSHDISESILLSGYGIQQGTVIGDRHYNSAPLPAGTPRVPMQKINGSKTGVVDYTYPFPTIMKIFNVPIPAQQITEAEAVTTVLKS